MEISFFTPYLAIQTVNHDLKAVSDFCTSKKRRMSGRKAMKSLTSSRRSQTSFHSNIRIRDMDSWKTERVPV